ncbi:MULTISPECIES: endonuclease/exonuclease/phosphatase family protein [Actinomadura]|uniref:Endonuclease/exonuclease/phosphatase family protein n=1 Tax=Actinomadura geliboluensis TaxID=882440 RepID=A0A5S4HCA8_9ACTN|nr:endonuclease/exonuclease/phosphatase family protein [Actinomadura geliboluensis]TMR42374.1 endonuclease/exonuclease/phosphatase family protein [Actinomadura geliboluensis]
MMMLTPHSVFASTTANYKIWHWNIAGHAIHKGLTNTGIIEAMRGSIGGRNPDFVSVNEMCYSQYRALIEELRGIGWPEDPTNFARFETMRPSGLCAGTAYGMAIFSRHALGVSMRYTLPYDGTDKERKLTCVPPKSQPSVKFCTTHLSIVTEYKGPQADYVHNVLEGFRTDGDTVIIAGDFNLFPNASVLNKWYSPAVDTPSNPNNYGSYHELDDQAQECPGWGEATTEEGSISDYSCGQYWKLDLTFANADRLISYDADAHPIGDFCGAYRDRPCSDHRILTSNATVTIG